jgi:hypothetical protein
MDGDCPTGGAHPTASVTASMKALRVTEGDTTEPIEPAIYTDYGLRETDYRTPGHAFESTSLHFLVVANGIGGAELRSVGIVGPADRG